MKLIKCGANYINPSHIESIGITGGESIQFQIVIWTPSGDENTCYVWARTKDREHAAEMLDTLAGVIDAALNWTGLA